MTASNDPVQVAPHIYSVLFENDRVRVLDVRMLPGAKSVLHTHSNAVWYLLTPMRGRFSDGDGNASEVEFPTGVVWRDAEAHAVENRGNTEFRAVAIELK